MRRFYKASTVEGRLELGFGVDGTALGSRRQDLDEFRRTCLLGLLHRCVGRRRSDIHRIASGNDGGVSVVPGVVARGADEDEETYKQGDGGEYGSLRTVVASGESGVTAGGGLNEGGVIDRAGNWKAEEDTHAGDPGKAHSPGQP